MDLKKTIPLGIYGITASKYSNNQKNIDVVKIMLDGGIRIIQYREKHAWFSIKQMHRELEQIRILTRNYGALLIVNDFIDLALAVDADGIHIGQDDLPPLVARKLIGNHKILGISTHSPDQANNAIKAGADYIGIGPIFATNTKENVCPPVGLEYLQYAVKNVSIPFIAIGGIKEKNLRSVLESGAKRIALVTEIVGAKNIEKKIATINKILAEYIERN